MGRNEVLSRVPGTSAEHVTWSRPFFGQLMTALVPLLGAALTQFPYVSDSVNQWLRPILRVLE